MVVVPSLLYVGQLGFYSDDWRFLANLALGPQPGFSGAIQVLAPDLGARPPHLVLLAALYQVAGLDPLGYHLASIGLLAVGGVGMYLILLELGIRRSLAFAACAVFVTLPQYSTDRFWIAAIQADIALAFFVVGAYASLRALRTGRAWVAWTMLAASALAISLLAYEVFVGLSLLLPLLVLWRAQRPWSPRVAAVVGVLVASILAVVVFKVATTTRLPEFASLLARARWFAAVLRDGGLVGLGGYGVGLPLLASDAALKWPDAVRLIAAVVVGGGVGAWTFGAARYADWTAWRPESRRLIVGGLVVFVAGLAIFVTNQAFAGTLSGSANRTMIAAAIGVALALTGLAGLIAGIWPPRLWPRGLAAHDARSRPRVRAEVLATLIGLLCLSGTLLNLTLAAFWVEAAREQSDVMRALHAAAPTLSGGASVLLAGSCPYVGPGVVFEAPWDVAGAIQIAYDDPTLRGDVVTPRLTIGDAGVTTEIYGEPAFYPYANLFVFDRSAHELVPTPNRAALERALASTENGAACGPGQPGLGQPVL
ncbi:MAG: hypothetical protein JO057_25890 [Chloroflexi bacterium]|nr:hypothetical protein [Chloroflexota bacterium]